MGILTKTKVAAQPTQSRRINPVAELSRSFDTAVSFGLGDAELLHVWIRYPGPRDAKGTEPGVHLRVKSFQVTYDGLDRQGGCY